MTGKTKGVKTQASFLSASEKSLGKEEFETIHLLNMSVNTGYLC